MSKLNIEPLSQRDNRWSRVKLGTSEVTIGGYGCVLTCVTMQCIYHGKNVTPLELNEAGIDKKVFYKTNLWDWQGLEKIYPDIKWIGRQEYKDIPADLQYIDDQLEKKQPVIIKVEADEIGTPKGDHFILIIGKEGDDYWVNDPWWRPSDSHPQQFLLSKYYSNLGSNKPEHIILGVRVYEGSLENQEMNQYDKKALEIVTNFANGDNAKDQKFGNNESAARDLVDVWDKADGWREAVKKSEELTKVKIEQALQTQKDQFLREKEEINGKWQSKLQTANNEIEELDEKLGFARNIAINELQPKELWSILIAKILGKFIPLPTKKEEVTENGN